MKNLILASCCLSVVGLTGCMDGPFYELKKVNPFFIAEWRADKKHGPTFQDKYAELVKLEGRIARLNSAEQASWIPKLEEIVRSNASPEMRRQAVLCIAQIPSESVETAIKLATTDDVEKVRLAACEAWKSRTSEEGKNLLLTLARTDESNSVRQAAVSSLSSFNDPTVIRELGTLLDDTSPAIQYEVAQSLTAITGQELGGDISGWKDYIGQTLPADTTSSTTATLASGVNGIPLPK